MFALSFWVYPPPMSKVTRDSDVIPSYIKVGHGEVYEIHKYLLIFWGCSSALELAFFDSIIQQYLRAVLGPGMFQARHRWIPDSFFLFGDTGFGCRLDICRYPSPGVVGFGCSSELEHAFSLWCSALLPAQLCFEKVPLVVTSFLSAFSELLTTGQRVSTELVDIALGLWEFWKGSCYPWHESSDDDAGANRKVLWGYRTCRTSSKSSFSFELREPAFYSTTCCYQVL